MDMGKIEALVQHISHIIERAYTEATNEERDPGDIAEIGVNVVIRGLALVLAHYIWHSAHRHRLPSREEKEKIRNQIADEIGESVRVLIAQHVAGIKVLGRD